MPERPDARPPERLDVTGIDLLDDRSRGPAGDCLAGGHDMHREGFHAPEGEGRWTNGRGLVAFARPVAATALSLTIAAYNPRGSRLRVMIDGVPSAEVSVAPGTHSEDVALPGRVSRIELVSDTFVPKQIGLGTDERTLGIFVVGMILR